MQNSEIARIFEELADLLEIQGSNPFRIRAYRSAARRLVGLSEPLSEIARNNPGDLQKIDGIGKDLAAKIAELVETGTLPQLEELREQVPLGVMEILRIPGLGPKKVAVLFHELGIQSLDSLRAAAEEGLIAELKGFGKKTETGILENLTLAETEGRRFLLADAQPQAAAIVASLEALDSVKAASIAGSCRRCRETVGDLDVLATADDSSDAMECLAQHELVEKVLSRGETKQRVRLKSGLELDLRVVPAESYGAAMQYFSGSQDHNIVLRRRAQERGLKLNEYGLFRDEERVAGSTEEEVYEALDLQLIPPELRENRGEIEQSEADRLPALITPEQIRGDLHMHTTATDGTASIREMAQAARERGLEYIAITDHSQRVTMANGLDPERLRRHWEEIRDVRSEFADIEILCGIECDILEDATLDLPDDVLSEADWVIAVLHYGLKQPREMIQKRLLHAIQHPSVDIIGHPTGRLVGRRSGADADMSVVLRAAADHGVMMEINAHPSRLDLDDVHAAAARDAGIPIVISTDAHSTRGFDVMQWGVKQARRAGLTAADVANTRSWSDFRGLLRNS